MSKEAMKLALEAKIHNAGMNPIMQGECYLMHPEAMQKIIDEALREALAEQPAPSQYGSPELQAMIVARALEKDAAEQPAPVQQEPATKNVVIANMGKPFTVKAYVTPQPAQQEPVTEFKSPGQRWEDGDDHDSRSEALYKFIAYTDFKHCGDSFCFKSGGDGDNGETLMFILDCWFAQQHISPQPAQQEQKPVALREALREAAAAALTSVYVCGRVWSAWHIGTMTEDDFSPASECDWLLDEIVHAVATAAPQPAQRKPLTDEQVNLFINGRGDEDDDDYVEPTGDGFGLTDADLVRLVRRVEAAHEIKENT